MDRFEPRSGTDALGMRRFVALCLLSSFFSLICSFTSIPSVSTTSATVSARALSRPPVGTTTVSGSRFFDHSGKKSLSESGGRL